MIQLLNRAWRKDLARIASVARDSVVVVAPYIKYDEAAWFCGLLRPGIEVITLANINVESVSASALDLAALRCLAEASSSAKLIALSNLHAKVFVADQKAAIVTSGNLTRSGLDSNLEYGVLLSDARLVQTVRADVLSFARLGSQVDVNTIDELVPLETDLREAHANIANSATADAKRKFTKVVRQARPVLASVLVGDRSAHAVFGEAIQFILARGPQTTRTIQQEVRHLMPDLCDDTSTSSLELGDGALRMAPFDFARPDLATLRTNGWRLGSGRTESRARGRMVGVTFPATAQFWAV